MLGDEGIKRRKFDMREAQGLVDLSINSLALARHVRPFYSSSLNVGV